jgi:peptidoglycan glycosyltransferase
MGRRIRLLGVFFVLCFGLIVVQLVNIQFVKAPALRASPYNPRNEGQQFDNQRGSIYASDGTLLADSIKATSGNYTYVRQYPGGALYSQVVGYDSTFYGTAGVEYQYNSDLAAHKQSAQNFSQIIGLDPIPKLTDDITLTIDPTLQQAAATALSQIPGSNTDAAVVALNPTTGAVLADYSTPTFDPTPLASEDTPAGIAAQQAAYTADDLTKDAEGFYPGLPLATAETFPPGSTFKVVTTAAVYNLMPSLSNFNFPVADSVTFPNSNQPLHNDGGPCGGTLAQMLPESCDPGYGQLGVDLTAPVLAQQAALLGYNSRPPIDLPDAWVATPHFPPAANLTPPNQAFLAYSAIGQYEDQASALSNALVAAGVANGGVIMTPHVVAQIRDSQGSVVTTTQPTVWKQAMSQTAAAQTTALMKLVATVGTAAPSATFSGFPPSLDVAVKTGTSQTQNSAEDTDDWMIGFAPANDPKIAVAVVVPLQPFELTGAIRAGPIMRAMLEAALTPTG